MKAKGVAVYIENKSGSFYPVILSPKQEQEVLERIAYMHNGKIKVTDERQPLVRLKNTIKHK